MVTAWEWMTAWLRASAALPPAQQLGAQRVEVVGDREGRIARSDGVGEHGEISAGCRHLGCELLGGEPCGHRHVSDDMPHLPVLAQRWRIPGLVGRRGEQVGERIEGEHH